MPPPFTPMQIPSNILLQQKQGTAIMIWAIGAFCIFGWEWLMFLPQEYKRIWTKPMNSSSVLYIANRYFGILQLSFVVTLLANVWGSKACDHVYLWEPVGALISTVLSQMILGHRVYTIFSQNKLVAFILGSTLVVEVVIGGIAISTTSAPVLFVGPVNTGPPCSAVMGPFGWLIAFWSIPLFYFTTTFLLAAWKAYGYYKEEVSTPLFNIIWRNGLPYFFAIFAMNLINVIILSTVPKALRAVNLTPTLVLEIVLSCRLILAGESPDSKPKLQILPSFPWSDTSQTRRCTSPSSSIITENHGSSSHLIERERKLEPNRRLP